MSDIDARLDAATHTVLAEISRTDAKAGVLLTAFSLPLAALVAAVPGRALPVLAAVLVGTADLGEHGMRGRIETGVDVAHTAARWFSASQEMTT